MSSITSIISRIANVSWWQIRNPSLPSKEQGTESPWMNGTPSLDYEYELASQLLGIVIL